MVTTERNFTVGPDGIVRVPADLAKPGETVTLQVTRPAVAEPEDQRGTSEPPTIEPVRLTRLTAKTPEQKEQWRRQMNELIDRLAPMLKDMPDHADLLYGDDGLPK